ncbi:hypothetical protein CsSME_00010766 [Camellia sinensis var. sinensis]
MLKDLELHYVSPMKLYCDNKAAINMNSGQLDHNGKCLEELSSEQLLPSDSPDISDIFGDPQVFPRVGNEYQVEIPPMLTESEQCQLQRNPADTGFIFDISHCFLMGLPIPVTWVDDKINNHGNERIGVNRKSVDSVNANESLGSKKVKKSQLVSNKKGLKSKTLDVSVDNGKKLKSVSSESAMAGICRSKRSCLVPGLLGDSSWTDVEVNSFLLAIYIFEKNLFQVKRFMESKEMGEILSFYYGKFYGTNEHRRYSDWRRMLKSKKCKIGQNFFTGWRQQELLSRLLPHVPGEAKCTLVEVSNAFAEGRSSLEEYVHSLKTATGVPILIEAVGIGKGKEDLTNLSTEPTKNNQVFPVQVEIPVGKACSSLTPVEIIRFLTGDFRLSKARSNDIFWEAVWPRLLARGWHSEQPKSGSYVSKHQLVFLVPGVKKFSKKKLVKGDHYFDSVSDVLSRVASEPKLIELEAEEPSVVSNSKEAHERDPEPEPTLNHSDPADHQQHCYLKPRVSTFSPTLAKFTIVDTSLVYLTKSRKVTEVRSLPADIQKTSTLSIYLTETDSESSGDSADEPESSDMLLKDQKKIKSYNHAKGMADNSNSNQRMPINCSDVAKKLVENYQDQQTGLSNEQSRIIKNQFSQTVGPGCSSLLLPVMKQRTLASCVKDDASCSLAKFMVGFGVKEVDPNFMSSSPNVSQVGRFHAKVLSSKSSAEGSSKKESSEGVLHENSYVMKISDLKSEKPQSRPVIDLNITQVPSDAENDESHMMEVDDSLQNPNAHVLGSSSDNHELMDKPAVLSNSIDVNAAEEAPIVNPIRQSTRNRPLTPKVVEAIANGMLSTKRKRRKQDNLVSRPSSRRDHIRNTETSNSGSTSIGTLDDKEGNGVDGIWNGNKNEVSYSLVETERKAVQELMDISKAAYHPRVPNLNDDLSS